MKFSILLVGLTVTVAIATAPSVDKYTNEIIDGIINPISEAIAHLIKARQEYESVKELLNSILDALTTPEVDYWGEVKDEVEIMVGQFINDHNIHQVEVYQKDLQTLMDRYNRAPVSTNGTYPNKNQQAADLSTSIILHRYLIEAALLPQSMILHFADISSIHIIILKDVAETYSFPGLPPSKWWLDLDEELDHYIAYGEYLTDTLLTWRIGMVACDSHTTWSYKIYEGKDNVTEEISSCTELKGTTSCENHCENYFEHKRLDVNEFLTIKMGDVLDSWKELKNTTAEIINDASNFYDPREAL